MASNTISYDYNDDDYDSSPIISTQNTKFDWDKKELLRNRIESITDQKILKDIYLLLKKHEPEKIKNSMKNNNGFHIYFQNLKQETYNIVNNYVKNYENEIEKEKRAMYILNN